MEPTLLQVLSEQEQMEAYRRDFHAEASPRLEAWRNEGRPELWISMQERLMWLNFIREHRPRNNSTNL